MAEKAFTYIRVSTAKQVEQHGPDRQRATMAAYAAAEKIEIVREFEEKGICGDTDLPDRKALMELLAALPGSDVTTILVENGDRFARGLVVGELMLADLATRGIKVIDCDARLDLTDSSNPSIILMRHVRGAVAQYDKGQLVARMRAGRERKKEKQKKAGLPMKCEGNKSHAERQPAEFGAALALAKELRGQRLSVRAIAVEFNARGLARFDRKKGVADKTPWTRAAVRTLLEARPCAARSPDTACSPAAAE